MSIHIIIIISFHIFSPLWTSLAMNIVGISTGYLFEDTMTALVIAIINILIYLPQRTNYADMAIVSS